VKTRFPFFGLFLIIVGSALLLKELDVLTFKWRFIWWGLLLLFGAFAFIRGFSQNEKAKVFWGTVAFLFGLYFILRSVDYFIIGIISFFPITLIIIGLAFLLTSFTIPRSGIPVVFFFLFSGLGFAFLLEEHGHLESWEIWDAIRTYWPLVLVLLGIIIIFQSKRK